MDFKKKYNISSTISFIALTLLGTAFHYVFKFSGNNTLIGAFAPVNESVWEHLKLLLFPAILISIPEYIFCCKNFSSFISAKCISILIGMLFIITAFYTYSGAIGQHYLAADIAIFVIASALTSLITYKLLNSKNIQFTDRSAVICLTIITAIIILFIHFTFSPPQIELFRDPISEDFGIPEI